MANPFTIISDALRGKTRKEDGVKRRAQTTDADLRAKREKERLARARARRLKQMGIK